MAKSIESTISNLKVSSDLPELFLAGVAKYFIEKLATPYVGNGTMVSGGAKLATGVVLDMFFGKNQISKIAKTALITDGVEDVTTQLLGNVMNRGNSTPEYNVL